MLTFDSPTHTYRHGGLVIPGVTGILSKAGMTILPPLNDPRVIRKRAIGKAVHEACQYIDEGDLDYSTLDPEVVGYVEGYESFVRSGQAEWLFVEHRVLIEVHGLRAGGTLDRAGYVMRRPWLLDLKTAASEQAAWALQTAGYALGMRPPAKMPWRWLRGALMLRPSGTFSLIAHKDPADFDVFLAALRHPEGHPKIDAWKRNHGISVFEEEAA